jgi:hypothetical protein
MSSIPRIDLRPGVTEPVVLLISRREIESGDITSVTSRLKPFLAAREDAWLYRGQMSMVIDGFNDDPRELVDIPEVREFLRMFDKQWPYWAFFFNQVDDSIKIYLSCVCGVSFPGGGAVEIDADKLSEFLMHGFAGMNSIFDRFGFSETELEVQSRGIVEIVEQT